MRINFFFLILFVSTLAYGQKDTVTITGRVTDYNDIPLDSVSVFFQNTRFSVVHEALTDEKGYYTAKVKKGQYYAMGAINMSEYPNAGSVLPEDDLRLEFWGWNFVADRDTTFNMQYHRLEVYGINPFRIQGATPGYTIYCRPMSLTRTIAYMKNKTSHIALAPDPDKLEVKITINGEEVPLRKKQKIEEYFSEEEFGDAYLLFVDLLKLKNDWPYYIFRIQMTDLENGDKGEGVYFLEKKDYIE